MDPARPRNWATCFAFADNTETYDAYMKAAKQDVAPSSYAKLNGIPCSYVVGKDGKIAFIGHPAFLDYVLPRVLAGTWDPREGAAEVARADAEFGDVYTAVLGPDFEKGMKAFSELEVKRPALAASPYFTAPRIEMLIRANEIDAARTAIQKAIAKASEQDDTSLLAALNFALKIPSARKEKSLTGFWVQSADTLLRIKGEKDLRALQGAAEAHKAAGDLDQFKKLSAKSIQVAETAVAAEGAKPTAISLYVAAEANYAAANTAKAKEWGQKALDAADNPQLKDVIRRGLELMENEQRSEDAQRDAIKPPSP